MSKWLFALLKWPLLVSKGIDEWEAVVPRPALKWSSSLGSYTGAGSGAHQKCGDLSKLMIEINADLVKPYVSGRVNHG